MPSIIFDEPWFVRSTRVVFFLLLLTFENQASFEDLHHLSVNGHNCKAKLGKCEVKYRQRNVCKITDILKNIAAPEISTKERRTRFDSDTFHESKLKKRLDFERSEKERKISHVKQTDGKEVSNTLNYSENLQEFDKLRRDDIESRTKFPPEDVCPYLSVRAKSNEAITDNSTTCKSSQLNESECEFVNTYLGKPRNLSPRFCPQRKTAKTLCWFGKKYRRSIEDVAELRCDTGICRDNAVHLGVFNTTLGQVMPDGDWRRLANGNALVEAISDVMKKNYSNHFRFCFLRCDLKDHPSSSTKQILVYPPILHHCPNTSPQRINVNIIVQDSISRPQFYRVLPKTVNSLREITRDPTIDSTVLDFEIYQSYDASTHSNIKKLFAGKNGSQNNTDVISTIKELYKKFAKASYKTLFQEDACWFEGFGSLLRPSFLKESSKNDTDGLWKGFYGFLKENLMPYVDSFGVGFSSCKVLKDLGDTNIFNGETLPKLCFDGRPLSHYYLNLVQDYLDIHNDHSCPVFSYLHLNTGHEHTGQRITQDDEQLAGFVKGMAMRHNTTLTILLSDHGGKTSDYATRTVHGLKEIYKPFMFMIVPRRAAEILGNERLRNLIRNQKRLVALEDLSHALDDVPRGFVQQKEGNNGGRHVGNEDVTGGLFSDIPANRNCSELRLSADAVCQCEGEDVETVADPFFLNFLASIAVGGVNNLIQSQYNGLVSSDNVVNNNGLDMVGSEYVDRESVSNRNLKYEEDTLGQSLGGYGKCRRYVLERVERFRSKVLGEERVTSFSVVLNTVPAVHSREEVFEMTLGHHLTKPNDIRLLKVTRLSRYSVYKTCADVNVHLDLCTCDQNSHRDAQNYMWELLGYYTFAHPSNIDKLEFSCLYLVTTKRQRFLKTGKGRDEFLAYEIINACDRIFNVTLSDSSLVRQPFMLSRPLPFSIVVHPSAAHYVISAFCGLPEGEFVASFKVDVV